MKIFNESDSMLDASLINLIQRYTNPLLSITDNYEVKIALATSFTLLNYLGEQLFNIMATDAELVFSLSVLIIIDFITGIIASLKNKRKITSMRLRSTIVKVIEYFFILLSLTILSNMHSTLDWVQTWSYIFICSTEVKSIGENVVGDSETTKKLFKQLMASLKQKNNVDV